MKTVTLISVGAIKTEKERKDGKVSRKYYTAYFMDSLNPFMKKQQRNIFQNHVGIEGKELSWKAGDPTIVSQFIGKQIPGQVVNSTVKPFKIDDKVVNSYTCVVLDGEKLETILKQEGHELATKVEAIVETKQAVTLND